MFRRYITWLSREYFICIQNIMTNYCQYCWSGIKPATLRSLLIPCAHLCCLGSSYDSVDSLHSATERHINNIGARVSSVGAPAKLHTGLNPSLTSFKRNLNTFYFDVFFISLHLGPQFTLQNRPYIFKYLFIYWLKFFRCDSRTCGPAHGPASRVRILLDFDGSGQHFGFLGFSLIISWYINRYESSNTAFCLIDFLRYLIYNNWIINKYLLN